MAQQLTVARPYAKALFAYAQQDEKRLQSWSQVLMILTQVVSNKTIQNVLRDPKQDSRALCDFIKQMTFSVDATLKEQLGEALDRCLSLLIYHNRLETLPSIQHLFQRYVDQQKRVLNVRITSAFELSDAVKSALCGVVETRFSSHTLAVEYAVDASILGGVLIRTPDYVWDASVRGKLEKLHDALIS